MHRSQSSADIMSQRGFEHKYIDIMKNVKTDKRKLLKKKSVDNLHEIRGLRTPNRRESKGGLSTNSHQDTVQRDQSSKRDRPLESFKMLRRPDKKESQ